MGCKLYGYGRSNADTQWLWRFEQYRGRSEGHRSDAFLNHVQTRKNMCSLLVISSVLIDWRMRLFHMCFCEKVCHLERLKPINVYYTVTGSLCKSHSRISRPSLRNTINRSSTGALFPPWIRAAHDSKRDLLRTEASIRWVCRSQTLYWRAGHTSITGSKSVSYPRNTCTSGKRFPFLTMVYMVLFVRESKIRAVFEEAYTSAWYMGSYCLMWKSFKLFFWFCMR